jgi:hypothetical protein
VTRCRVEGVGWDQARAECEVDDERRSHSQDQGNCASPRRAREGAPLPGSAREHVHGPVEDRPGNPGGRGSGPKRPALGPRIPRLHRRRGKQHFSCSGRPSSKSCSFNSVVMMLLALAREVWKPGSKCPPGNRLFLWCEPSCWWAPTGSGRKCGRSWWAMSLAILCSSLGMLSCPL